MNKVQANEKPMPIIYTTAEIYSDLGTCPKNHK